MTWKWFLCQRVVYLPWTCVLVAVLSNFYQLLEELLGVGALWVLIEIPDAWFSIVWSPKFQDSRQCLFNVPPLPFEFWSTKNAKKAKENPCIKQKQKKGKGDLPSSLGAGAAPLPKQLHDEALDNQIDQPSWRNFRLLELNLLYLELEHWPPEEEQQIAKH